MALPSTAWKSGQSGNPNGSIPIKLMRDTLMLVLNEQSTHEKYKGLKRLRRVADRLVTEAENGNVLAIKEILDRIDGKVPSDVNLNSNKALNGQSFDELAQGVAEALVRLRGDAGRATETDSCPQLVDSVHTMDVSGVPPIDAPQVDSGPSGGGGEGRDRPADDLHAPEAREE